MVLLPRLMLYIKFPKQSALLESKESLWSSVIMRRLSQPSVKYFRQGAKFHISRNRHFCLTRKVTQQIIHHWKALFFLSKNLWVVKTDSWSVSFYWPTCNTPPLSSFWHISEYALLRLLNYFAITHNVYIFDPEIFNAVIYSIQYTHRVSNTVI